RSSVSGCLPRRAETPCARRSPWLHRDAHGPRTSGRRTPDLGEEARLLVPPGDVVFLELARDRVRMLTRELTEVDGRHVRVVVHTVHPVSSLQRAWPGAIPGPS